MKEEKSSQAQNSEKPINPLSKRFMGFFLAGGTELEPAECRSQSFATIC